MFDSFCIRKLGDVDEAFDAFLHFDKSAEGDQPCDLAFDYFPSWITFVNRVPRIPENLLQSETQAGRRAIDLQDYGFDAFALFQDIARTLDSFGPRQLRYVNQPFDAGSYFDKSAKVGQPGNFAHHSIAWVEF